MCGIAESLIYWGPQRAHTQRGFLLVSAPKICFAVLCMCMEQGNITQRAVSAENDTVAFSFVYSDKGGSLRLGKKLVRLRPEFFCCLRIIACVLFQSNYRCFLSTQRLILPHRLITDLLIALIGFFFQIRNSV